MEKPIVPNRECTEHISQQPFSPLTTNKMHLEICRVCLGTSGVMINIFGSTPGLGIPIAEMISSVTGHHVFRDEFFSEIICRPCLEDTTKAFKIKQTYDRSYQLLCQVKEDFRKEDDLLEDEVCKISKTQSMLDNRVKTEPLDGSEQEIEKQEREHCPVKNEPVAEDSSEEEDHQIYNDKVKPENYQISNGQIQSDSQRKREEAKRRHKCSYCPKIFPRPGKLEEHIRSHTRERPFKCPQCPSIFTTSRSVKRHLQSHMVDETFKCSHCSCSFKAKVSLKRHLTMHKKRIPFKCDICQHSYEEKRALEIHRANCIIMTKLVSSGAMILPTP